MVDEAQVRDTFARMAVLVDEQNAREPGYQPTGKDPEHNPSFQAALEPVFAGRQEPNGYTQRLHRTRPHRVAAEGSDAIWSRTALMSISDHTRSMRPSRKR